VIAEQIRGRMGFDGLLISDDLDMKALSGDIPARAAAVLAAGCDIALNCWGRLDDMNGIAEQVPVMTAEATERLARACAPLRVAQTCSALDARIDALVARRESLA
jgi:beta-N-acetylhexosaminidase